MPFILLIVGILAVLIATVFYGDYRFKQMVADEVNVLFACQDGIQSTKFPSENLNSLPEPVRKYLRRCIPDGQDTICIVRLRQTGSMCLSPEQEWKPFTAEQYFTVDPPAFIWRARLSFIPMVWVSARDKYLQGQGNMLIKILSMITVADAKSPKTKAGAFIRFAAEMMWFPTSLATADYLQWEAIDATSARAIVKHDDVSTEFIFHFDEAGDVERLVCMDRYQGDDDPQPTRWGGTVKQFQTFNGVRIPSELEVWWDQDSGYFAYWRGKIEEIEFNVGSRY